MEREGVVQIDETKMSTRSEPEGTLLFHAPSSRLVRLTGPGETLWSQMIAGERDINRLVDLHRQEAGVSAENAAFRVYQLSR